MAVVCARHLRLAALAISLVVLTVPTTVPAEGAHATVRSASCGVPATERAADEALAAPFRDGAGVCLLQIARELSRTASAADFTSSTASGSTSGAIELIAPFALKPGQPSASSQPEAPDATRISFIQTSSVSARWEGQVVYAIFTSAAGKYHEKILAQLDTWAATPYREGRFVVMGGKNYPENWKVPNSILGTDCDDSLEKIACKEASLLVEGHARQAAWLVILGEDNWVDTVALESALQKRGVEEPEGFGALACGQGLNTYCPQVDKEGGFCGGAGYALNRAMVGRLLENGPASLKLEYGKNNWPNDMQTSCSLRQRGMTLSQWPVKAYGNAIIKRRTYLDLLQEDYVIFHYLSPDAMRWLHAMKAKRNDEEVARLEELVFTHGCARCHQENECWRAGFDDCLAGE